MPTCLSIITSNCSLVMYVRKRIRIMRPSSKSCSSFLQQRYSYSRAEPFPDGDTHTGTVLVPRCYFILTSSSRCLPSLETTRYGSCHLSSVISIDFFNFAFGFVFSRRRARGSRKISVPVRCDGRGHIHMNYYYLHRYFTDCKKYL